MLALVYIIVYDQFIHVYQCVFFQKEKFNENIEEMLAKLEEFCGMVDAVCFKNLEIFILYFQAITV